MSKFVKTVEEAILPKRATLLSAGYDLHALIPEPIHIYPGSTILFQTGVSLKLGKNEWGEIKDRSGLSLKASLSTGGGVIDTDYYPRAIGVILHNVGNKVKTIMPGDRIAQLIIQEYKTTEDDEIQKEERTGGFGHTGK